ncbi:acyl-CoA dehydrogenase [Streptomyces sp. NPDC079020]|uniref:acyl-CoA dehydrogenase n=1 Tax=Streptomyces sp. NPDC079020 TaxID=3365722 RepID=UPI0037D57020
MGGPLRAGDILKHATEYQLDTYLRPLIRGERACCFSLTETDAGSDVRSMRTVAVPDGAGYRLTGHKVFSSAGPFADFAIVVARMAGTGEQEGEKPLFSAFLVDLDSPGCRVEDGATPMSGEHIESDIVLDDCHVPAANLLGEEGMGMRIALGRVTTNRLLHCPTVLGATRRAIALTLERTRTRKVAGGQPLLMMQAIQHKVADMATEFYAARSMTYAALAALDEGREAHAEAFMCKLFVAESAFRILDEAVQIHGKEGLTRGTEIEFLFRKIRMFRILTGTSEIQRNGIAKLLAFNH